jgi:hypothetical protein
LEVHDPLSLLLFDSVMDVLHLMLEKAATDGLSELARTGLRHHTSMYADDVVTFFRPTYLDLHTYSAIVEAFGVASVCAPTSPSAPYTPSVARRSKWSLHVVFWAVR